MPRYEMMYISSMDATAKQVSGLFRKAGARLQAQGGIIRRVDHLGLRPMAYRMRAPMSKKWHEVGRYIRLQFTANPDAVKDFEKLLRRDEDTIRFLTMKQPNLIHQKEYVPAEWTNAMPLDPALTAYVRKGTNLDFFAARTLLEKGILTESELEKLSENVALAPTEEEAEEELESKKLEAPATP